MIPIIVTWNAAADGFPDTYTIFYNTNNGQTATITVSGTSKSYLIQIAPGSLLHLEIWSTTNKVDSAHVTFDYPVP